ncbi:MAG: GGDEF domain-containing protein [Atopobiaceae bacterium]|nr:GGDEF domain-containing protein [Atopobiaceae bacterium]
MSNRLTSLKERATRALLTRLREVSPRMRNIELVTSIVAAGLVVAVLVALGLVHSTYSNANTINQQYESCQKAAQDLQDTSDYLTSEARLFVATHERMHMDNYLDEIETNDRRGNALRVLNSYANSGKAAESLKKARTRSNELALTEMRAIRLVTLSLDMTDLPPSVTGTHLSDDELALSAADKLALANDLVYNNDYMLKKFAIRDQVQACSSILVDNLQNQLEDNNAVLNYYIMLLQFFVVALLVVTLLKSLLTRFLLLWPIAMHETSIRNGDPLIPGGAQELRTLTDAYNEMYERNSNTTESLRYEAHNDALTGLLNRGAYDELLFLHRRSSALILVDIDYFKQFNDEFGHEMGDAVLVEVAATLYASFRSNDYVCRIGGDEFAVIMTNASPSLRDVIAHKIDKVAAFLHDTSNGLPSVGISVGIAFGDEHSTQDGLFNEADRALYDTKRRGRNGYTFAHELPNELSAE